MDPSGIIIGAVGLVMAGLVVYVVTRAASRGELAVNSAIGIRTGWTKSSQQAWEVAHRAALPFSLVACLLSLFTATISVVAVILANAADASHVIPVVVMVAGYVGFVVVMILATAAGNRAVKALSTRP